MRCYLAEKLRERKMGLVWILIMMQLTSIVDTSNNKKSHCAARLPQRLWPRVSPLLTCTTTKTPLTIIRMRARRLMLKLPPQQETIKLCSTQFTIPFVPCNKYVRSIAMDPFAAILFCHHVFLLFFAGRSYCSLNCWHCGD